MAFYILKGLTFSSIRIPRTDLELYPSSKNRFKCFCTRITDNKFQNTFKIEEGAAFEKVGRLIMDKTGVTALLQNAKRPSPE